MTGLVIAAIRRVFQYSGLQLVDPGETLTPDQVRDLYSATYPEISNASVAGPKVEGNTHVYEFVRVVRDKG